MELIDQSNQQEVRPFPCNWEGCEKVRHREKLFFSRFLFELWKLTLGNKRLLADDLISQGIDVFIPTSDRSNANNVKSPLFNVARSPSTLECIQEKDHTVANGWDVESNSVTYVP